MLNDHSEDDLFDIVRYFFDGENEVIEEGVTEEEARTHCNDPETSSKTCTSAAGKRLTENRGPWFDGYVRR